MRKKELWTLYQQTCFVVSKKTTLSDDFCIITACNPYSANLSPELDAVRNTKLVQRLQKLHLDYQPLIGCSEDLAHQEASFAIQCSVAQGKALSCEFAQNAFYAVLDGQLWLQPALLDEPAPVHLGPFIQRIISDSDTA